MQCSMKMLWIRKVFCFVETNLYASRWLKFLLGTNTQDFLYKRQNINKGKFADFYSYTQGSNKEDVFYEEIRGLSWVRKWRIQTDTEFKCRCLRLTFLQRPILRNFFYLWKLTLTRNRAVSIEVREQPYLLWFSFALWLVQKTHATSSTNQMQNLN